MEGILGEGRGHYECKKYGGWQKRGYYQRESGHKWRIMKGNASAQGERASNAKGGFKSGRIIWRQLIGSQGGHYRI